MIDKFCNFITRKIKENVDDIDEEKELVINFGVMLIFGELPKILILFLIGFILGIGWHTVLMFLLLMPYRSFTGGFHLKTHLGCMVSTAILYLGPILIGKYAPIPTNSIIYIMTAMVCIFSIILIYKYAPADTENVPILSKKERRSKKIKAYIVLAILITISMVVTDKTVSCTLIYGIFIQNLTVMPISYKLTKCKHGYEVYTD